MAITNQDGRAPPPVPVCGIGASAGGIEALQEFFGAIPHDLGLAYVVVVHLAPDRKSELPHILAHRTRMPVVQVGDHERAKLEPDHVYVIAPDRKLVVTDTSIGAAEFEQPRGQRMAIDLFFRSLAEGRGDGFAVVLSGSGSDGALGAKAVKEHGGLILVQDPADAAHGAMPRAVLSTGVADVVLPVRELAVRLAELTRNKYRIAPLLQETSTPEAIPDAEEHALRCLLELLRKRTGHDFSHYKRNTVLRRLARRMQLSGRVTIADYLEYVQKDTEEARTLFDDFLISVTTFFRDPQAWLALQAQVIGPLLEKTGPEEQIRVWVAGCSTGEEAYTLAILFQEEIERRKLPVSLIIFASDVDESALAAAREGLYPHAISADVSESRLERFFRQEGEHYRVVTEVRDRLVFAAHNLLRDPPFSRLHLISCRNLLIYLDGHLQQQVMQVFRYALCAEGYLFLGAAELADEELFRALDMRHRIFGALSRAAGTRPELPAILAAPTVRSIRPREAWPTTRSNTAELHLATLEQIAPPSVLTDERWNLIHLSPSAARFLQQSGGPQMRRITDCARPELRDELHALMTRAMEQPGPHVSGFIPVSFNGTPHQVAMLVEQRPTDQEGAAHLLVSFLDGGERSVDVVSGHSEPASDLIRELRERLRHAEQRIGMMREEHHTTEEDLRAANEELQSLNEEYRSTTEELETSKEELQSINEELQTVNNELKTKLEEVNRAHSDLENLMASTDVGTLFLDLELRIKRFTPRVGELFNIKMRDIDRPIVDITHTLSYDAFEHDARQVLANQTSIEREAASRDGCIYIVRMSPYRLINSHSVDGVVVIFIDVTPLKAAETALRQSQQRLAEELETLRRLHHMTTAVATAATTQEALQHVLDGAIGLQQADFGELQLLDQDTQELRMVAHRGLHPDLLERYGVLGTNKSTSRVRALGSRCMVQIPDVLEDAAYASLREVAAQAGYRAVQSTPLISRAGTTVGIISVYFRSPHSFDERDRQFGEILAQQAADLMATRIQQDRLVQLNEKLQLRTSELEASQKQLSRQAADLIEQDRNRDEFLAALGHELRNPMSAIHNSIAVISVSEPKSKRALDVLRRQSRHMLRLINDLLDITRVKHGHIHLERIAVDVRGLAKDALEVVGAEAERKGLALIYAPPAQSIYVEADPERLAQILDNLLRNAVTYTESGAVTLQLESEPRFARVTVRDTGIGIDPGDAEALFKPYQRRAVDQRSGGLGLGLALVKALVEAHGGTVSYKSGGRGNGSTFSFTIPLAQAPPAHALPKHAAERPAPRRVLVVDDQKDVADMLGSLLEHLGQGVRVAYDGEAAMEIARAQRPEVAFIDLSMPGIDGLELAQRLRRMFPNDNLALVAITGDPQAQIVARATEFTDYILKPAGTDDLLRVLRSAIR